MLSYERCCDEIVTQTRLLTSLVDARGEASDARVPVPACPGWNIGQLLRHVGGVQRWAADLVSTRAQEPVADDYHGPLDGYRDEDLTVVVPWLAESASLLGRALQAAGSGTAVWTPVPGGTTDFYARRFTHEALVHRADAVLALGDEFSAAPAVVTDALDEWMELGALPLHLDRDPRVREVLAPGHTLRLHASDAASEAQGDWFVDMTGAVIAWRHADEPAAVTVEAPLSELLLLVYRRHTPEQARATVSGDARLLEFWLDRVAFG